MARIRIPPLPPPIFAVSPVRLIVEGNPVCSDMIPAICHPLKMAEANPLLIQRWPRPKGRL